jgi:hypothetical protein
MFSELWSTLSTKDSLLSSKRIERMVFTVTVVTITWIANMYNLGKWSSTDHVITLTPLLLAAGYNVIQERRDKKLDKNIENEN